MKINTALNNQTYKNIQEKSKIITRMERKKQILTYNDA